SSNRRAACQAFETIIVKRTCARKRISLTVVGNADVSHLGVNESVHRIAIHQPATTDSSANGQVNECIQPLRGAPSPFPQRASVPIAADAHPHAELPA